MLRIGISIGDVTGIGPEVTLKALAAEQAADDTRYVLIGDADRLRDLNLTLRLNLPLEESSSGSSKFIISNQHPSVPSDLAPGSAEASKAAVAWVRQAADMCLRREIQAMITAPVNKEAIVKAGISFVGQTELLSEMAKTSRTAMMLLGTDERGRWLRVTLASTHLPLRAVADHLTVEKILQTIELSAQACRELGLPRSRIGICGLNPHAGEGGKIGTEELTLIGPAVKAAQARGIDAVGPVSADALFYYALRGHYEVVLAMYHDQGLAPLKMVAFDEGVNWTVGLPFIRTSPDHGTAYDIAGQGIAKASSMIAALRLAKQLAKR